MSFHRYHLFGLDVALPHPHRALPPPRGATDDVTVEYGTVPDELPDLLRVRDHPSLPGRVAVARSGDVLWTVGAVRLLISRGVSIKVESHSDAGNHPADVLRSVLANGLPAALIQRHRLALHASAVATPAGAVVIAGCSGAGKSTLLAKLTQCGHSMLSDDVSAIARGEDGSLQVEPGFPVYRLCADALERLEPRADRVIALGGVRGKFAVATPQPTFRATPMPLRAIYLLAPYDGQHLRVSELRGLERLAALRSASYAPMGLAPSQGQLDALGGIAAQTRVYRLERPRSRWTVDALVNAILEEDDAHVVSG